MALALYRPKAEVLADLQEQFEHIETLRQLGPGTPDVRAWRLGFEALLEHAFAPEVFKSKHAAFESNVIFWTMSPVPAHEAKQFYKAIEDAKSFVTMLAKEVAKYGVEQSSAPQAMPAVDRVVQILRSFHKVALALRVRHGRRTPLEIADEHDVQDILAALFRIDFSDVRKEEFSSSVAGQNTRIDFVLKVENIAVEAKKTRATLGAREAGTEIAADILRYQAHPDVSTVVFFVYDPESRISNPTGFESDLTRRHGDLNVIAIVNPKP